MKASKSINLVFAGLIAAGVTLYYSNLSTFENKKNNIVNVPNFNYSNKFNYFNNFATIPNLNFIKRKSVDELLEEKYDSLHFIPNKFNSELNKSITDTLSVTTKDLLNNEQLWRELSPGAWDIVPQEIRDRALTKQYGAYSHVLYEDSWKEMSAEAWDSIPSVVRMSAYLKMAVNKADKYELQKYSNLSDARGWFTGLIIQESYLDYRAINQYYKKSSLIRGGKYINADLGLGQHSDWARNYLRSKKQFKGMTDNNFFNPDSATDAAAFFFRQNLIDAGRDVELATKSYNVGMAKALKNTKRARIYLDWVKTRYDLIRNVDSLNNPTWFEIIKQSGINEK